MTREWAEGRRPGARGNTLIELLVVIAIIGVIAGVTGLAFRGTPEARVVDSAEARLAAARRQAIQSGRSVTVSVVRHGRAYAATANPDGSVVADTSLAIDRLSGRAVR
jgi:prepilin-type N-terminal cleavage/methylation domain-containing protein